MFSDELADFKPKMLKTSHAPLDTLGITGFECSLLLEDKTSIQFYVNCVEGYTPSWWTVKVNGEDAGTEASDGLLLITIPDIPAHLLGESQTIEIVDHNLKFEVSALSYPYMVMKNHEDYTIEASTKYVYMVAALYDYYVTASDYYAYVNAK